jgi:hypothetical protein
VRTRTTPSPRSTARSTGSASGSTWTGEGRRLVEHPAPADLHPDDVGAHDVDAQLLAVHVGQQPAAGLAHVVDPLEADEVVGGGHARGLLGDAGPSACQARTVSR